MARLTAMIVVDNIERPWRSSGPGEMLTARGLLIGLAFSAIIWIGALIAWLVL